jgi:hypothetical protein
MWGQCDSDHPILILRVYCVDGPLLVTTVSRRTRTSSPRTGCANARSLRTLFGGRVRMWARGHRCGHRVLLFCLCCLCCCSACAAVLCQTEMEFDERGIFVWLLKSSEFHIRFECQQYVRVLCFVVFCKSKSQPSSSYFWVPYFLSCLGLCISLWSLPIATVRQVGGRAARIRPRALDLGALPRH